MQNTERLNRAANTAQKIATIHENLIVATTGILDLLASHGVETKAIRELCDADAIRQQIAGDTVEALANEISHDCEQVAAEIEPEEASRCLGVEVGDRWDGLS